MKNLKKALSIFMALCMMLVSVQCISAFATADSLTKLEKDVTDFSGRLSVEEPSAADLEAYEGFVSAFKALSADEKEAMDIFAFDKLYHLAFDREKQISIKNNPELSRYDSQHSINAHAQLVTALGGLPAYTDAAVTLAATLGSDTVAAADKVAAFGAASKNARIYAGLYKADSSAFTTEIGSGIAKGFELAVNAAAADLLAAEPFGEAEITKPDRPYASDYPGGRDDPDYIRDYDAYWAAEVAYNQRDAREQSYKAELNLRAMAQVSAVATEYAAAAKVTKALVDAKAAYAADKKNTQPAADAVKAYEALTGFDAKVIGKLSYKFFYEATVYSSFVSVSGKSVNDLYKACIDIGNAIKVDDFVALISSMSEPYTRANIDAAKAAYGEVPSSLTGTIPSEIMDKYKAILASVGPDDPSEEQPDLSNMPSTEVKYPIAERKVVPTAESLYKSILALAGSDEATFSEDIKKAVFSSSFIGTVVSWLYPTLWNASSIVAYTPASVGSQLTEEKYAKAVEKLNAATSRDDNGGEIKNIEDWNNVSFENGDFGFEDGDKEAFLDALSATFRRISVIGLIIKLENSVGTSDGTYSYGAYEELVSVFEALDLDGIYSSHEYTLGVEGVEFNRKMDARVRPILVPIANLVEKFANDPVNTLLDVLPKLGYAVDSGLLNTQVNKLISKVRMIKIGEVDLTAKGLFGIINKSFTAEDASVKLVLSEDNFVAFIHDLAGCGTYAVRPSIARGTAYRAGIDSNEAAALIVTWNYLYGELVSADNVAAISGVIDSLETADFVKSVAKGLVSAVAKVKSGTAFRVVAIATIPLKVIAFVKNVVDRVIGIIKK